MPSQSVRHLVKTLGAASLVGVSSVVGSPIAGAMVMTVGGSIVDALAESGVDYIAANHPFRRGQALNHDLQAAFQQAFATAVERLEKQWWDGPGKSLPKDEREPVRTFFELLQKDSGATLSNGEMTDLLHTAANIRSGGEPLQQVVNAQLGRYLHGHDERLIAFISSRLLDEIALCFSEELKTNDRAWRSYQRLVNEGLQEALRQSLAKQDQIARQHAHQIDQVLDELRRRNALLYSKPPEQRDPLGEDALDRVHDRLAAKIAEEAEQTRETVRAEHDRTRAQAAEGQAELNAKLDVGFTLILTQLQKQATSFTAGELLRSAAQADIQVWRVPRPRNPHFIGREAVLDQMVSEASGQRSTPIIHPILGMAGIGKSQLAAEVAYRRSDDCNVVWWIRAQDSTTLVNDLAALAAALDLPEARIAKPDDGAAAARAWLESSTDAWLIILDNAEAPDTIERYLPTRGNGHILITSRIQSWRYVATPINLNLLSSNAATTFLLKRTGQDDASAAAELAGELGHLPLALEHAAAFIDETRYPIARYLELVRTNAGQLLGAQNDTTIVSAAVTTVWHASIAAVASKSPGAYALLKLGAFLAPEMIPLDLIGAHTDTVPVAQASPVARAMLKLGAVLRPERAQRDVLGDHTAEISGALTSVFRSPSATTEAVGVLYRYSLVDVGNDQSMSIHRLVQLAVRESMPEDDRRAWASVAVTAMRSAFPIFDSAKPEIWPPAERLLPHALAACEHAADEQIAPRIAGDLLQAIRWHIIMRSSTNLARSRELLDRTLNIASAIYGPDHPECTYIHGDLGKVLRALGDLIGARREFEQALRSTLTTYGPDHLTVVPRRQELGSVLLDLGDLVGARREFERALAIILQRGREDLIANAEGWLRRVDEEQLQD